MTHNAPTLKRRLWIAPLWLWAVLALAGVAFAAWLLVSIAVNASVTTAEFGPFPLKDEYSFSGVGCSGVVDLPTSTVTLTWAGATPENSCRAILRNTNQGGTTGYGHWEAVSISPELFFLDEQCGAGVPPANVGLFPVQVHLDPDLSQPGEAYSAQLQLVMSFITPNCQ
jgi:hypothetical protein